MARSDWLRYSLSILWLIASSVAACIKLGAAFLWFQNVCEEDLDQIFERLVDL